MVEFALVTPILLLLILGMLQAGFGMLTSLQLHHAAQQAAIVGCTEAPGVASRVYGSVPDGFVCAVDDGMTVVRLADTAPVVGPFGEWRIGAEARAMPEPVPSPSPT